MLPNGIMGRMTVYTWFAKPVPVELPVRQVYGWIFDAHGRVMIWREGAEVGLPGGRPEPSDADIEATLRREVREEITAEVRDPHYLGYQRVDESDHRPPFAQVRMVARLGRLHPPEPDPDTGSVKNRAAVAPERALAELNWGQHGREQLQAATELAFRLWGLRAETREKQ